MSNSEVLIGEGATHDGVIKTLQQAMLTYRRAERIGDDKRSQISVTGFGEWLTDDPLNLFSHPDHEHDEEREEHLQTLADDWGVKLADVKGVKRLLARPYECATVLLSLWTHLVYSEDDSQENLPAQFDVMVCVKWLRDGQIDRSLLAVVPVAIPAVMHTHEELDQMVADGLLSCVPEMPTDGEVRHRIVQTLSMMGCKFSQMSCAEMYRQAIPHHCFQENPFGTAPHPPAASQPPAPRGLRSLETGGSAKRRDPDAEPATPTGDHTDDGVARGTHGSDGEDGASDAADAAE